MPLALPGDRLRVRIGGRRGDGLVGEPVERLEQAPRTEAPCPPFWRLRRLPAAAPAGRRLSRLETRAGGRGPGAARAARHRRRAAREHGAGGRRRARLAFVREGGAIRLGFRQRTGHRVVAVRTCPVLAPELVALLPPLGDLLGRLDLARGGGEVELTASATGIDLLVVAPAVPGLCDRETLAEKFADGHDLARISWAPAAKAEAEPIAERREPSVAFDQVRVAPPRGRSSRRPPPPRS